MRRASDAGAHSAARQALKAWLRLIPWCRSCLRGRSGASALSGGGAGLRGGRWPARSRSSSFRCIPPQPRHGGASGEPGIGRAGRPGVDSDYVASSGDRSPSPRSWPKLEASRPLRARFLWPARASLSPTSFGVELRRLFVFPGTTKTWSKMALEPVDQVLRTGLRRASGHRRHVDHGKTSLVKALTGITD